MGVGVVPNRSRFGNFHASVLLTDGGDVVLAGGGSVLVTISPSVTLTIPCVTHAPDFRTADSIMLTFTLILLDGRRLSWAFYLLSSDAALCTCTHLC